MRIMKGLRIDLSGGKTVFVAYDPLPHPRAEDGEGFAVSLAVDGQAVVQANMSAETIEALYRAYKAVRKERRRNFRYWFSMIGMLHHLHSIVSGPTKDDR